MRPISDTQPLMESIFPGLKDYPMNVMITSLTKQIDGLPIISLLVILDDKSLTEIKNAGNPLDFEMFNYTKVNPNGHGKDFFLKFKFLCSSDEMEYIAEISANDLILQNDFLQALKTVNAFYVWIANKDRKVEKVISVNFDYEVVKDTAIELLSPISVSQ